MVLPHIEETSARDRHFEKTFHNVARDWFDISVQTIYQQIVTQFRKIFLKPTRCFRNNLFVIFVRVYNLLELQKTTSHAITLNKS